MNSHYIINQTNVTIKHQLDDQKWIVRIFVNGSKVRHYVSRLTDESTVINNALVIVSGIVA